MTRAAELRREIARLVGDESHADALGALAEALASEVRRSGGNRVDAMTRASLAWDVEIVRQKHSTGEQS